MDEDEFAATLMGYRQILLRVAARVVGGEDCEDAAQEAIVKAWLARGRFDGRSLAGWAATICRNVCIDQLRRGRLPTVPLDTSHWLVPGDEPGPEAQYLTAERAVAIRLAVSRLPPGQRRAVWGVYFRGLAAPEVAALLGLGEGSVNTQTFRARATLRRELAGWR